MDRLVRFFELANLEVLGLLIYLLELSLTVPIVNTLAFLFTVLGDWWVDKKVISRGMFPHKPNQPYYLANFEQDTWIGMTLSLCGEFFEV